MKRFFHSFKPIYTSFKSFLKPMKRYKSEIFLLTIALISSLISFFVYLSSQKKDTEEVVFEKKPSSLPYSKIFVDVAGAVEKPDVYEITIGARLKDVLIIAGGLSAQADRQFFSRYFNLARILSDQEKIYIPSVEETQSGIFVETTRTLNFTPENESNLETQKSKININTASLEKLDEMPGVGKVTAEKIIKNRPYQSPDELLTKKVVKKSVYEKIKDLISTHE